MNYFERLQVGGSLFSKIIIDEKANETRQEQRRLNFLQSSYEAALYNPNNLPKSARGKWILGIIKTNKRLNFLKAFGGSTLLADLNEPFIDAQVRKNKITEATGQNTKLAIKNGVINQSVIDGLIGGGIHWVGEKLIHYQYLYDWSFQVMPYEAAVAFNGWFFIANAGAVPYFLPRSIWELRRIGQERSLTKKDVIIQAAAVVSNLLPGVSALSTPLLNYPRAEGLFGPKINEWWEKTVRPFK